METDWEGAVRSRTAIENYVKRDDRHRVDLKATAFRADGSPVEVRLHNMSYEGCQIEAEADFGIGERIRLVLPRMGEIKAQVRWTSLDGKAGVRFLLEEFARDDEHSRLGL